MLKEIVSKNGYSMEMVKRIMESVVNLPAKKSERIKHSAGTSSMHW